MLIQKYEVGLSATDRKQLTEDCRLEALWRTILRANILCRGQNGKKPMTVRKRYSVQHIRPTVQNVQINMEKRTRSNSSAEEKGNAPVKPKVTGEVEAHITVALACGSLPGDIPWTLCLLATSSQSTEVYRFDISYAGWSHSKKTV